MLFSTTSLWFWVIVFLSSSAVFYKVANTAESPFQRLDKSTILMIRKQDGTKIYMDAAPDNTANETTVSTEKPAEQKEQPVSEETIKNADAVLFALNCSIEEVEGIERFIDCEYYEVDTNTVINNTVEVLKEIEADIQ